MWCTLFHETILSFPTVCLCQDVQMNHFTRREEQEQEEVNIADWTKFIYFAWGVHVHSSLPKTKTNCCDEITEDKISVIDQDNHFVAAHLCRVISNILYVMITWEMWLVDHLHSVHHHTDTAIYEWNVLCENKYNLFQEPATEVLHITVN